MCIIFFELFISDRFKSVNAVVDKDYNSRMRHDILAVEELHWLNVITHYHLKLCIFSFELIKDLWKLN